MNYKNFIVACMCVTLAVSAKAVTYTVGDTWLLEGATQWTNDPNFVGLGTIQSTAAADTNKVWYFLWYKDIAYNTPDSMFTSPMPLNMFSNSPTIGPYRYPNPNVNANKPFVSDTNMDVTLSTWGARQFGAVVWESPLQGTVNLHGLARYAYGEYAAGILAFGVFYQDVSENKFYQLQKGILAPAWDAMLGRDFRLTNAVVDATVSVDVGDRLIYMNRDYWAHDGYEYLNSDGYPTYNHRWSQHRNLTVTYQSATMNQRAPAKVMDWKRKDVNWRADGEGVVLGTTDPIVMRDRRVPDAPARFNYYTSTNLDLSSSPSGLTAGEVLTNAALASGGYFGSVSDDRLSYSASGDASAITRPKPPVWLFRPPQEGYYTITGTLVESSWSGNSISPVLYWIGVAGMDGFAASPVVQSCTVLSAGSVAYVSSNNISLQCILPSTNHVIYMTIWAAGWLNMGSRGSSLLDNLTITRIIPKGLVFTGW